MGYTNGDLYWDSISLNQTRLEKPLSMEVLLGKSSKQMRIFQPASNCSFSIWGLRYLLDICICILLYVK